MLQIYKGEQLTVLPLQQGQATGQKKTNNTLVQSQKIFKFNI